MNLRFDTIIFAFFSFPWQVMLEYLQHRVFLS
jgi:hypothetical protein